MLLLATEFINEVSPTFTLVLFLVDGNVKNEIIRAMEIYNIS